MSKDLPKQKDILLKQAEIFSSLLDFEIEVISENSEFKTYKSGESIFSKGDPGNCLYIIESGEIVVQKQIEDERKTDIARFVQGNCFGELDLFTESSRNASAIASEDSRLLEFPGSKANFTEILDKHPNISAIILHKILVEIAGRIRRANTLIKENSPLVQELRKQVYRDKMTGLFNQTYLTEEIEKLITTGSGFFILISKPDNFKALNDTYGHEAGDTAIRIMAEGLRDFTGDDSRTARYKGNAISVILIGATKVEAYKKAEEIREFLNEFDFSTAAEGNNFKITASIGICSFPEHGESPEELLVRAHNLPLRGRNMGGNKILFPEDIGELE